MVDKTIPELDAAAALAAADLFPVSQSGGDATKTTLGAIDTFITNLTIQNKTANYTAVAADHGTIINCTTNAFTIATDPAATVGAGYWVWIWNANTTAGNAITINPNASETIDGVATLILRRGEGCIIESDGTNWQTVAGKKPRAYVENIGPTETRATVAGDGAASVGAGNISVSGNGAANFGNAYNGSITLSGAGSVAISSGNCVASAQNSMVSGNGVRADIIGKWAHGATNFSTSGDTQLGTYHLIAATTNNTPSVLTTNNSAASTTNQIILPNDSTFTFSILVTARRTDANDESAGYKIEGVIDRGANAAATALVGSPTVTVLGEDTAGWDVAVTADTTNGGLAITVTGENAKTIRWTAIARTVEVSG